MISFNSLQEAFNYKTICPFCHHPIKIDNQVLALPFTPPHLFFDVTSNSDDLIQINIFNDNVNIIAKTNPLLNNSIHYKKLKFICSNTTFCLYYSYSVQIHIDFTLQKITNIILNSEYASITYKSSIFDIYNSYTFNTSKIIELTNHSPQHYSTPLIPFNFHNTNETIEKILKCKVFS